MVRERDHPRAEVHDRERCRADGEPEQDGTEVVGLPQQVDRHIEKDDGLDEVRAVEADRADVVGRDHDRDQARDQQQRGRYLEPGPQRAPRATLPAPRDVERDRQQDEDLEWRGGDKDRYETYDEKQLRRGGYRT